MGFACLSLGGFANMSDWSLNHFIIRFITLFSLYVLGNKAGIVKHIHLLLSKALNKTTKSG